MYDNNENRTWTWSWTLMTWLACLLLITGTATAAEEGLTLFGWSDQHVKTNGDVSHLLAAIDAMNELPGTTLPKAIGGKVATPAFVLGCGDVTEWPTHAAVRGYATVITERLKFPCYDIMGNHDDGGKVPSDTMKKWIIDRQGGLSYTFDKAGVHFIGLFSQFDPTADSPAQALTKESLDVRRQYLTKAPAGKPIVVATHLCFDAITNRDELVDAFGDSNVILMLGGHYHKATVHRYRGFNFVQLPSPRDQTEVTVIRISPDRLVAIPYNHAQQRWSENPRKILDITIHGPASSVSNPCC